MDRLHHQGKQNLHEDVLKTSWRGVNLEGFFSLNPLRKLQRITFYDFINDSANERRNVLLCTPDIAPFLYAN